MDPNIDNWHCNMCKLCNRSDDKQCRESCRRCGTFLFSEDKVNVYQNPHMPYLSSTYYHYPYNTRRIINPINRYYYTRIRPVDTKRQVNSYYRPNMSNYIFYKY